MFERIVVPLDGSQFSTQSLRYAIEIAKRFGSEVILLRVVAATPHQDVMALSAEADEVARQTEQSLDKRNVDEAKRYLKTEVQRVIAKGVKGSIHTVVGDAAKSIIQYCEKEKVDLVIMTTHGKSGIKRAVLGSVADEVIRQPGLHVLSIRPPERSGK